MAVIFVVCINTPVCWSQVKQKLHKEQTETHLKPKDECLISSFYNIQYIFIEFNISLENS